MFVWLVAPKQFFSLIHRKIIENYKINQFDTNLDSFEASLGFGTMQKMSKKETDEYFAYQSAANMNGRMFYCPSTIATFATIITAYSVYPVLQKYDKKYVLALFESIVVLCYACVSKIKKIDTTNRDEALRWTVDIIFSTMEAMDEELDPAIVEVLKTELLHDIHVFIYLMVTFQHLNAMIDIWSEDPKELIMYILWDHHRKTLSQKAMHAVSTEFKTRSVLPVLDEIDDELLWNVLPSDSLIISLLSDDDWYLIAGELFAAIINPDELKSMIQELSTRPEQRSKLMKKVMDYTYFKEHAHAAIQSLARKKFWPTKSYEKSKEIDSFMSTIEQKWSLDGLKIPDAIREESMLMDKIMNFYIGFVWGLFVARGDSFEMRTYHAQRIQDMYALLLQDNSTHDVLYYYWWLLYHYSKNLYFYQYAFDNIKAWKEMFALPLQSKNTQSVYTNMHLIDLMNQASIPTLFQDFNEKILVITLSNPDILTLFKDAFGSSLTALLSRPRDIVESVYRPVFEMCSQWEALRESTVSYRRETVNLKENLYTVDFWLWREACDTLSQHQVLQQIYDDPSIISTLAMLRDTWTWWLIWMTSVLNYDDSAWLSPDVLWKIYVVDVLNVSSQMVWVFETIWNRLMNSYGDLLKVYTKLDDTPGYLARWLKNWKTYHDKHQWKAIESMITWEDIVWFRSYLKSIQYYTKRYLKPKW